MSEGAAVYLERSLLVALALRGETQQPKSQPGQRRTPN